MRRAFLSVGPKGADLSCASDVRDLIREAQEVILAPDKAAESFPLSGGRDVADLYGALRTGSYRLFLARNERDAREHLCRSWRAGDATMCLRVDGSAVACAWDGTDNPLGRILDALPAERRIWIGRGSNTWKSDLDLAVRYCRTMGPADRPGASLDIPWMAGIPGTIGGWIKMNAGAFGHSISEVLAEVCVDGVWRSASSCAFAYRHSEIDGEIQDYRLLPREAIRSEGTSEYYRSRRRSFPAHTFGSFFKNPEGDFAGRLLEAAGAKSLRVGGAHVWSEHANVIVFDPPADASDILALSRLMQARVCEKFGIRLEPEVSGL